MSSPLLTPPKNPCQQCYSKSKDIVLKKENFGDKESHPYEYYLK